MSTDREWEHLAYGGFSGPPAYFRRWRGTAEALDRRTRSWVPIDSDHLSRYTENGESDLDDVTPAEIEAAVGFTLPA